MSQRLLPERLTQLREHLPLDVVEHIDALTHSEAELVKALRSLFDDVDGYSPEACIGSNGFNQAKELLAKHE